MAAPEKSNKLPLTLESFAAAAALVATRGELRDMIDNQKWLPADLLRVIPPAIQHSLSEQRLNIDVVRVAEAAIREIDATLARYGFEFPTKKESTSAT